MRSWSFIALMFLLGATGINATSRTTVHHAAKSGSLVAQSGHSGLIDDMCRYSEYREPTTEGFRKCVSDQIAATKEISQYERPGDHNLQNSCTDYVTGAWGLGSMEYVDAQDTLACVKEVNRDLKFSGCVASATGKHYDGHTIFWSRDDAEIIAECFNKSVSYLRSEKIKYFPWEDGAKFFDSSTSAHAVTGPVSIRRGGINISGRSVALTYIREMTGDYIFQGGGAAYGAVYRLAVDPGPLRNGNWLCSKTAPARYIAIYRKDDDSPKDIYLEVWDGTADIQNLDEKGLCGGFSFSKL